MTIALSLRAPLAMAKPSRDCQSPSSCSLVERGSSSGSRVKTGSSSRSLHNTGSSSSLSKVYTGSDSRSSSSLVPRSICPSVLYFNLICKLCHVLCSYVAKLIFASCIKPLEMLKFDSKTVTFDTLIMGICIH